MSDHVDAGRWDSTDAQRPDRDGIGTVEAYEVEDGTVLYDAENPLAWVESSAAVPIRELA
ncbi:hypothetical protein DU504_03620 [Haloplanus salinus]|jgi:hypothetical protein|uniref:Uncharacterized protein n=1 Tax=Haloplanus salinus TaxID=1126245 RepID=A0A368N8Y9_9EURY|nr:hypothetical protein [Haloplanus salinus]RCU46473.1 hypothetical protein DU504_03620 [Haloplanus salinus]